jgi:thiosulfate/3-mercaptopyruvate sulfurtransferase
MVSVLLLGCALGAVVFLSPEPAYERITQHKAVVLDARGRSARAPYLPGARTIDWRRFRDGWFRSGRLTGDRVRLQRALEERGIRSDRPVLVYAGMGAGWGEEGRIWWMLAYLGHRDVRILDGGIQAWERAGLPVHSRPARASLPGSFHPCPVPELRATAADITRNRDRWVLLDVRTPAEFTGSTPYGEARGGHIPGALNIHWKKLLSSRGDLKPLSDIRSLLGAQGVAPDAEVVVVYCTGGVRSAFAQAVLIHAGFPQVRNYDASWWDWAATDSLPVER